MAGTTLARTGRHDAIEAGQSDREALSAPSASGASRWKALRDRFGGGRSSKGPARWLRIAVLAIGGLYVLYLVAANVILGTGLLRGWVGAKPEKLRLDYASAWSPWPGRVYLRDLTVRFQDDNVQLYVDFPRAAVSLSLLSLPKKTLDVTEVKGEDLSFRIRHKVDEVDGIQGRLDAFPPIPGFADLPIRVPEVKDPNSGKPWILQLAGISTTIRELWVMEVRYLGHGSITGGFRLDPSTQCSVSPTTVLLRDGVVSMGGADVLHDASGKIEANIEPFEVKTTKGLAVFHYINAHIHQDAQMVSAAPIGTTYLARYGIALEHGEGPLTTDVHAERGKLLAESKVSYRTDHAFVTTPAGPVEGDVSYVARIETGGEKPALVASATSRHATFRPNGSAEITKGKGLDIDGASVDIDLGNADITEPFALVGLNTAAKLTAEDVRIFQPLTPDNIAFEGGAATLAGRGAWRSGRLEGRLDATLSRLKMKMSDFTLVTSGKVWSNLEAKDWTKDILFPGGGADLTGSTLDWRSGHAEGVWLRARTTGADIRPGQNGTTAAAVDIEAQSGPPDQTLAFFTRLAKLPDVAANTLIPAKDDLRATVQLRVKKDDVTVTIPHATNGPLDGRGRIRKQPKKPALGAFLLTLGPVRVGLDMDGSGVGIQPFAYPGWLDEKLQER